MRGNFEITISNARGIAANVLAGKTDGGLAPAALALWIDGVADRLQSQERDIAHHHDIFATLEHIADSVLDTALARDIRIVVRAARRVGPLPVVEKAPEVTLDAAVQQAARDLPDGHTVDLSIEHGSAAVALLDAQGSVTEIPPDGTLAEQVLEALRLAEKGAL